MILNDKYCSFAPEVKTKIIFLLNKLVEKLT